MALISQLDELLPFGLVATRKWLGGHGVSRHTMDNWLKSQKLISLVRGVMARPGVPVTWQGLLVSLDRMMPHPVYVGGVSALELAGFGHYLKSGQSIRLYSAESCPGWLNKLTIDVDFSWQNSRRLWPADWLDSAETCQPVFWREGLPDYLRASPEQAYLEALAVVPEQLSFEHADELLQGLTSLSPRRLDVLLLACQNVKVKRLFMWFANRHQYAWFNKLSADDYDLGSGKRVVARGGKLDREFLITVPAHLYGTK